AVPNAYVGLIIYGASNNLIGGSLPGEGNVISGNLASGVGIEYSSSGNTVQGNLIGVAADGTTPLGNSPAYGYPGWGVYFYQADSNTLGGANPGAGNIIQDN